MLNLNVDSKIIQVKLKAISSKVDCYSFSTRTKSLIVHHNNDDNEMVIRCGTTTLLTFNDAQAKKFIEDGLI